MRKFLAVATVLALLATCFYFRADIMSFVNHLTGDDTAASASPTTSSMAVDCSELTTMPEPETLNLGVVVDPTSSTASSFSQTVMAALADQLSSHMPAKTSTPQDGVATVDAINLVIKQVGSNPYAYGAPDFSVRVPGVQGLPPRPSLDCMDTTYAVWTKEAKQWSATYDSALAASSAAVDGVRSMPLTDENSGIRAALSSLVVTMPGTAGTSYLLASDFEENVKPQTAGDMGGRPLVLVAACPSGDAAQCSGDVQAFGDWATSALKAGPISVYRPELTAEAVEQLFSEASK